MRTGAGSDGRALVESIHLVIESFSGRNMCRREVACPAVALCEGWEQCTKQENIDREMSRLRST